MSPATLALLERATDPLPDLIWQARDQLGWLNAANLLDEDGEVDMALIAQVAEKLGQLLDDIETHTVAGIPGERWFA